jgi:sugar/nucleoside kinase (ribokinase family)
VIKIGPEGCLVFEDTTVQHIPGFSGAFLASIHRGLSYTEAARVANAAGAMNVEQLGAAKGVRSWDDTQAWVRGRDTL